MDYQKPLMRAKISLSGARAAYIGPGLKLKPHRNVAVTLAIGLGAPFSLQLLGNGDTQPARLQRAALIASGTLHHLYSDADMAFVYLDACSDDHLQLRSSDLNAACGPLWQLEASEVSALTVNDLCALLGVAKRQPRDARMLQVIAQIDARPQDFTSVTAAAASAGVSASRFQSLFRAEVGVPFRRYRLWRRMAVVAQAAVGGASLTEAALDAGFSSSSHLSAAFKQMFGLSPSSLLATGVAIETC